MSNLLLLAALCLNRKTELIAQTLDRFHVELPSWGFANTGTRFGKFLQPAAASTIEEKFSVYLPVDGDIADAKNLKGFVSQIADKVLAANG